MKLHVGASLLVLAQGQYGWRGGYDYDFGGHTVEDVKEVVPNPAGRWEHPNICLDCFDTGVLERNGQSIPISTDPNWDGTAGVGGTGPLEYIAPSSVRTTNAPPPNPRGGPEWIVPQAQATVAVSAPPVVYAQPVYIPPPAPVAVAPVLPSAVSVAATTPFVTQVSQFAAPPVAVSAAALPQAVVVAPAPLYTRPAVVAAPVAVTTAYTSGAGRWEGQTPARFQGFQNVGGVGVPVYADWGGVPIPGPVPYGRPYFGGGWY